MGCGGSKESVKESRKIKAEFKEVGLEKYDRFFDHLKEAFEEAEKIRYSLTDAPEEGAEDTETYKLKDWKYIEVFRVVFWALSSNAEGKISKCKYSFTSSPPFIELEYWSGLYWWTAEAWDTCSDWLKACCKAPERLVKILEQLEKALEECKDWKPSEDAGELGMMEKMKAGTNFGLNLVKLQKAVEKCKNLKDVLAQALKDLAEIGPQLKDLIGNADEIGAKAFAEGLMYPWEIFEKFHTGPRKSAQELEQADKDIEVRYGYKRERKMKGKENQIKKEVKKIEAAEKKK